MVNELFRVESDNREMRYAVAAGTEQRVTRGFEETRESDDVTCHAVAANHQLSWDTTSNYVLILLNLAIDAWVWR